MNPDHSPVALPTAPDPDARADHAAQALDRQLRAAWAPWTGGMSPVTLGLAALDWSWHLASQPAQASRLGVTAWQAAVAAWQRALEVPPATIPDARFAGEAWQAWPWRAWAQGHLATQDWWARASQVRGMRPHHQAWAGFMARQLLDMMSPANFGLANPEVLRRTAQRLGGNLQDGAAAACDTWREQQGLKPLSPPAPMHRPGREVAITSGQVVHRNALVELIQYSPTTETVLADPVLIVPSWIMKYYILDLSPHNSMVRWLVNQGHTVFILSWRNPEASDALLGLQDYLDLGVFEPLSVLQRLMPDVAVHACGYCLGGTLLAMAAAALARPGSIEGFEHLAALRSLTLLAAETDFSEPGELGLLIDDAQVALLEDMMAERGYLSGQQMADSFTFLHARDLVWNQRLKTHWLGEPAAPNDLMAWNRDVTRLPAAMHSEYLRRCYLGNELANGRFLVQDRPVSLRDLHWPMFVVGTETDHVSPWRSVYKIHNLTAAEVTFVLTQGGHNAGIVSEPGHGHRHHAVLRQAAQAPRVEPDAWRHQAQAVEGSWWPTWHDWLFEQGQPRRVPARRPSLQADLGPAPGRYVHCRHPD